MAALLVVDSGFAVRCRVEQHQMNRLMQRAQQRQQACLALGLQWEANDQERQYRPGTSAGTNSTVGPISGFVMDVTENEFGHAEGRCHAINASYKELIAEYLSGSSGLVRARRIETWAALREQVSIVPAAVTLPSTLELE